MTDPAEILSSLDFDPELPCEFRKHWTDTKNHDEGPARFWLQIGHNCNEGVTKRKVHAVCDKYAAVIAKNIHAARDNAAYMRCDDCKTSGPLHQFLAIIGRIK